jgi:hypothetical protein
MGAIGILSYVSNRNMRRSAAIIALTGAAVVAIAMASKFVPVQSEEQWMDPVSGSIKDRRTFLGIPGADTITISPLESRLHSLGYQWKPNWYGLFIAPKTIWGTVIIWEDGLSPPIYQLHPLMEEFAAHATDAEVRRFADAMESGTREQQEAAVGVACDEALAALSARP